MKNMFKKNFKFLKITSLYIWFISFTLVLSIFLVVIIEVGKRYMENDFLIISLILLSTLFVIIYLIIIIFDLFNKITKTN